MICYMPFSYHSKKRLARVIHNFGKITIYQPAEYMLPEHMRSHRDHGDLEARIPVGIDQVRLRNVLQAFKGWAGMLQPRSGDLAALFNSMQGRPPMMEETSPSQIKTQIRRYGQKSETQVIDPVFQAALFMAMAHEYDSHQDALSHELGSVKALEGRMFERLSGRLQDVDDETVEAQDCQPEDAGVYMTEQRLDAWAVLASTDPHPPWVYITHSRAVWESLHDRLPETVLAAHWTLDEKEGQGLTAGHIQTIENLAFSRKPIKTAADEDKTVTTPYVMLHMLSDCDHLRFCSLLSKSDSPKPIVSRQGMPVNILLGLLVENE
jgi:hypothetical protein